MTLKIQILRCWRRLFIILVSLTMKWFSEKMLISTRCIHGFMSNLIKKSWTDSTQQGEGLENTNFWCAYIIYEWYLINKPEFLCAMLCKQICKYFAVSWSPKSSICALLFPVARFPNPSFQITNGVVCKLFCLFFYVSELEKVVPCTKGSENTVRHASAARLPNRVHK